MEITFTTPALLFPIVSLLMLAYTNRFLTIATIIRNLHDRYKENQSDNFLVSTFDGFANAGLMFYGDFLPKEPMR